MVTMPAAVSFGTVEWTAMLVVGDTVDAGVDPDAVAAVGTCTFTPQLLTPLKASAALVSLLPQPVTESFDVNGHLSVRLIATDDADLIPTGWTWHVTPNVVGVPIPAFDVSVPAGTTVDLTTVMPLSPSPGVFIGYGGITAEDALDAVGAAVRATAPLAVVVSDVANTITWSTTATVNASDAYLLARANHTGTQSSDTLTDGTTSKAFLASERTKLAGVATAATANSADAVLLARGNHTGTQAAATVSDFTEAVQDAVAATLVAGAGMLAPVYNDAAGTITLASTGGTGGLDAVAVVAAVGAAMIGTPPITVTYSAVLNTLTISTAATVNQTDAYLLARANHTGLQAQSTVTGLVTALAAHDASISGLTSSLALKADLTALPVQYRNRLTADFTAAASSVVMANVPGISMPLLANEEWDFEVLLYASGDAASDMKLQFTGPTGTLLWCRVFGPGAGSTGVSSGLKLEALTGVSQPTGNNGLIDAATISVVTVSGTVKAGTTAGTFQLQTAQGVSGVTAHVIRTGSMIVAVKK